MKGESKKVKGPKTFILFEDGGPLAEDAEAGLLSLGAQVQRLRVAAGPSFSFGDSALYNFFDSHLVEASAGVVFCLDEPASLVAAVRAAVSQDACALFLSSRGEGHLLGFLLEALGIAFPGSYGGVSIGADRGLVAFIAARQIEALSMKGVSARRLVTTDSLHNAISLLSAMPAALASQVGSSLRLLAELARILRHRRFWEEAQRASRSFSSQEISLESDGTGSAAARGGVWGILQALRSQLELKTKTVALKNIGEIFTALSKNGQLETAALRRSPKPSQLCHMVKGNICPEGAVALGMPPRHFTGKVVFLKDGQPPKINPGDFVALAKDGIDLQIPPALKGRMGIVGAHLPHRLESFFVTDCLLGESLLASLMDGDLLEMNLEKAQLNLVGTQGKPRSPAEIAREIANRKRGKA